jgi:hypothetical protein
MAKVDAFNNFPTPTNKKQLMRFLGMIGFYRKFCLNFATTNFACPTISMQSSILGIGYASVFVTELTLRKSVTKRNVLSDLGTRREGEFQSLLLVSIISLSTIL